MKSLALLLAFAATSAAAAPQITVFNAAGTLAWTNAIVPGISTVKTATALNGNWSPVQNVSELSLSHK